MMMMMCCEELEGYSAVFFRAWNDDAVVTACSELLVSVTGAVADSCDGDEIY